MIHFQLDYLALRMLVSLGEVQQPITIIILLLALVSGTYERCCVLFNVASLQSQIGRSQNFDSDEGLKNAAKHFQV